MNECSMQGVNPTRNPKTTVLDDKTIMYYKHPYQLDTNEQTGCEIAVARCYVWMVNHIPTPSVTFHTLLARTIQKEVHSAQFIHCAFMPCNKCGLC